MTSPGDEKVEVVDEHGTVLRVVSRAEMRAGNLRHRTTYVVVRTAAGEVVAHRRADDKDYDYITSFIIRGLNSLNLEFDPVR